MGQNPTINGIVLCNCVYVTVKLLNLTGSYLLGRRKVYHPEHVHKLHSSGRFWSEHFTDLDVDETGFR